MEYSADTLKKMVTFGILAYPLSTIINVLEIPMEQEAQFAIDFDNPESEIARHYKKGIDQAEFAIDAKLFELAKGGDFKAIERFERKRLEKMQLSKKEAEKRKLYGSGN